MKTFVEVVAFMAFIVVVWAESFEIDRIYKGWFLNPHEFPWMVKLKVRHLLLTTFLWLTVLYGRHVKKKTTETRYFRAEKRNVKLLTFERLKLEKHRAVIFVAFLKTIQK